MLVEYGWALKSLGYGRIVPVMNIAHGDPIADAMPFNMRHLRNPIAYHCPDDLDNSARKDVRDRLATEVEAAIRAVFDSDVFKESLPKMRYTEQGQLRAYMDVRPRKIGPTTTGDIVAHVTLVNSGQVPARRVGNNLKICRSADGNKKEFEPVEIENPEALLIVPGAEIVGGSQPLKPDEAAQYRLGAATFMSGNA